MGEERRIGIMSKRKQRWVFKEETDLYKATKLLAPQDNDSEHGSRSSCSNRALSLAPLGRPVAVSVGRQLEWKNASLNEASTSYCRYSGLRYCFHEPCLDPPDRLGPSESVRFGFQPDADVKTNFDRTIVSIQCGCENPAAHRPVHRSGIFWRRFRPRFCFFKPCPTSNQKALLSPER